ncbi:hypothetical protein [Streptomyces peucetius]|uniref:Uncharacterized protein n=1 Tax=Streptomyces peucetius TaxID=1950 RepID=A0ABY6IE48_STRPE|nr:hypothetical protein [Streptomyces peucetius]UYQ64127.1 hypothetical protein OGH68_23440 [Streptomyces peucetius]
MDYCSTCRRHLNGALVCPGCGAYAPDIAPSPVLSAGATTPAEEPYGIAEAPAVPPAGPPHSVPAGQNAQGRAARRRQLARWKKNKRRAAAGTAIALVGGALTVAALPSESGKDQAHAAAAPDTTVPDAAVSHRAAMSSTQQPLERASRAPQPPAPAATTPAVPRQRTATAPTAPASNPVRTVRTVSEVPQAPEAPVAQPTTTAPAAPAEQPPATSAPAADEPQAPPAQTASTSPTEVCLLVLCLG